MTKGEHYGEETERGSALIETVLLGLLLLVPLMWALGVLADVHRAALATTAAVREAGFDAASATSMAEADAAVTAAVERALSDHGLDARSARVRWASSGLERGGQIEVELSYPVTVAQAPLLGEVAGPSIWTRARQVTRIDPFRSRP